jgi:hypothetical protein
LRQAWDVSFWMSPHDAHTPICTSPVTGVQSDPAMKRSAGAGNGGTSLPQT